MTERLDPHSLVARLPRKNDTRIYRAPGRVNIVGEHTDYTGGLVLPTNSAIYTWVAAEPRPDQIVNITTIDLDQSCTFSLDNPGAGRSGQWHDYVVGVVAKLAENGFIERGADMVLQTEIPLGGGLSSSAALELAIAVAMLDLSNCTVDSESLAQLCQHAEHEFVGTNCGILDQFAVANCRKGQAMALDCRDLSTQHVNIPSDLRFLLVDSGVKHQHASGEYNVRASECAKATAILNVQDRNIESLRDLDIYGVNKRRDELGDLLFRRCRHVVTENGRVKEAFAALKQADAVKLGSILNASHASLRDDYEVSCDDVDTLVDIANGCDGVFGSRMVGGGFGGCVLAVADADKADNVLTTIGSHYRTPEGFAPWTHIVEPTDAAQRVLDA